MTRRATAAWLASAAMVAVACSGRPPAKAQLTRVAEAGGARVFVSANAWTGESRTAVLVQIENRSGEAVRVVPGDMRLESWSGTSLRPLPSGSAVIGASYDSFRPTIRPGFDHDRFSGGGQRSYQDAAILHSDGREQPEQPLPAPGPIGGALPEGPLEDGERVAGVVYFQPLPEGDSPALLVMVLASAKDGHELSLVSVPCALGR